MTRWQVGLCVAATVLLGTVTGNAGEATDVWQELTPPGAGFAVLLPGTPTETERPLLQTVYGPVVIHLFVLQVDGGRAAYMVSYTEPPEVLRGKGGAPGESLDGARDELLATPGRRLVSEKSISLNGYPGRELEVDIEGGQIIMRLKLYETEDEIYEVGMTTVADRSFTSDDWKFYRSFTLLNER